MAKGNTNSAYNQSAGFGNGFTDDMRYWNDDAYKRRAEGRIEDEIELKAKEKKEAKTEALKTRALKYLDNYDTGSTSLNEMQGRLLQNAMSEYPEIIKILDNENASQDEKLKAQLRLDNLHNLPEKMQLMTGFYTEQDSAYQKGKESGSLFEDPDYEKAFSDDFSGFFYSLDENMNPMVATKDTNGDGIVNIKDVQTYDQIQKGLPTFNFQKKFDTDKMATTIASEVGERDVTGQQGFTSTQIKSAKLDAVKERAVKVMIKEDGTASDVAKSELRKRGLEDTKENLQKITDEFEKQILDKTDYTKFVKIDQSALTSRLKENRDAKKEEISIGEAVRPTDKTYDFQRTKVDPYEVNSIGVKGVKVKTIKGADGKVYTNADVRNITFNREGQMVVDASALKTKSITKKEYEEESKEMSEEEKKNLFFFGEDKNTITKVLPGESVRGSVIVTSEDAAEVAKAAGTTVEELKKRAIKNDTNKKRKFN